MYTVIIGKFRRKSLKEVGHDTESTENVIEVCLYNCLRLSIIIKEEADVTALALLMNCMHTLTTNEILLPATIFYRLIPKNTQHFNYLYYCLRFCIIKIKEVDVTALTLLMCCMHTLTANKFLL